MIKISAAIATYNEENNIGDCLKSIKNIVDEIIIVDGSSQDRTAEIAREMGAKVTIVPNDPMFHTMKQKSFDIARGEWILYLDADERVSPELAKELVKIVNMSAEELERYQETLPNKRIFQRHQQLLVSRDGQVGQDDREYVAFFFPRLNYFLGKYLRHGGVYPDGVIRFFKRGKAYLPCKDLHEQPVVDGRVGWTQSDLLHIDSPTFGRYLARNKRYIERLAKELKQEKVAKDIPQAINFLVIKPLHWFLLTQLRHKGILDGFQGIVFSFFSALRFPRAYLIYLQGKA